MRLRLLVSSRYGIEPYSIDRAPQYAFGSRSYPVHYRTAAGPRRQVPGTAWLRLSLTDDLLTLNKPTPAAAALGRKGGTQTAKRGSEYFRQLAAKRKTRAGGRPRKDAE